MKKVDRFIDSVYKNIEGSQNEIDLLKEEMRGHIMQVVQELKAEGKSEDESVELALERFGDKKLVGRELLMVFNVKKRFEGIILTVTLMLLSAIVLSFIAIRLGGLYLANEYESSAKGQALINEVEKSIKREAGVSKEKLDILFDENKYISKEKQEELKYVAIFQVPQTAEYTDYSFANDYNKASYIYEDKLAKSVGEYKTYINRFKLGKEQWYIELRIIQFYNTNIDTAMNFTIIMSNINLVLLVLYWLLFGTWASIRAYRNKRLHFIWVIVFFTLNILGYMTYKLSGNLNTRLANKKRLSN